MKKQTYLTYGFAAIVLSIVGILLVPLPPLVLDALLAFNILGSGIVLLLAITIGDPLEFAAFAPALLIATLFRLALDVSATRLILTQGHVEGGVGDIIPAFGALVVHGNLVVGLIVFAILITIQFIVIASGAGRVAEVAARFTLDAMPGKQMAIDAEMHAGLLDADGARRKRAQVQREADFYGAMDGAGKFVKGDAIAALVIVVLNLLGGIVVGFAYHGMSVLDALNTFAILSIGNALVTTLPAFLLSTSMGLMVTRVAGDGSLGIDIATQVLERPGVLRAAGAFAAVLALVPALPHVLFGALGTGLFGLAHYASRAQAARAAAATASHDLARRAAIRRPEMALALVGTDAVAIDIGADLAGLLAPPLADALLDRIGEVRRALAGDIGIVLPGVRLRDDLTRDPATYAIRVRDGLAGEGRLRLDRVLAVADEAVLARLGGERVREPVYGMPAAWLEPAQRETAMNAGALVFDPISIVGSHLAEIARTHAAALLGRQELHTLVEHLRASVPSLVKEIGNDGVPLVTVHRVFEALLRERVWPRDPVGTLEALVDAATSCRDPRELTEAVRRRLVPALVRRRDLPVLEPLILDSAFEAEMQAWLVDGTFAPHPVIALHLRTSALTYGKAVARERAAVVCTSALRPALAEFFGRFDVRLDVFAYVELPPELELRPALIVKSPQPTALAS
ncbi:MAG: FHIPEP family type III secretion protein [Candidatus Eremiobacteraeota bacterium]|nr:FHIPEP family type III secretion protein [Candidatus Eremiobacteraeota bacterium]MBC5802421.1 FHIPEP family type III secretion protein [Candidatus Eremiobacteraeota bacterium]MBC5821063.1 FHIPEP family type III secretion protein [Candidatus Eremiobacteraeota bacterium]